jgi:dolichyl-phosphate beta-glucosyltransferase
MGAGGGIRYAPGVIRPGVDTTFCLVVPCYNEAARLHRDELEQIVSDDRVRLLLVDDGSTDTTLSLLRTIERGASAVEVVALDHNVGKAEAVRQGLRRARSTGCEWVGYIDADFATPACEIGRLLDVAAAAPDRDVVLGSRVALLGRDVTRSVFRHYAGRVFATVASVALRLPVYDTQCGAKLFRGTAALDAALDAPFRNRWAFDVELIGRLLCGGTPISHVWEEPLEIWADVGGSRRTVAASVMATLSLLVVRRDLVRWRTRRT